MICEIELFPKKPEEHTEKKEKRKYNKEKPSSDVKHIQVIKGDIYLEFWIEGARLRETLSIFATGALGKDLLQGNT